MIAKKWLARPYEATEWQETDIEPTEELRRFLEFMPNDNHQPAEMPARLRFNRLWFDEEHLNNGRKEPT